MENKEREVKEMKKETSKRIWVERLHKAEKALGRMINCKMNESEVKLEERQRDHCKTQLGISLDTDTSV